MQKYTYTELPNDVAEQLAVNAGVLLDEFNPLDPPSPTTMKSHIFIATSGGVNVSCVPTYSDWAEDVDNAPKNTKEFKHLDSWESKFSGTGLSYTANNIKSQLGAATLAAVTQGVAIGLSVTKVTPNDAVAHGDFKDLWYVTDWNNGNGFIAVRLINALSDGGFTSQSADNGKGQLTFSYIGHKSAADLTKPPMEFYVVDTTEATGKYAVIQQLGAHIVTDYEAEDVAALADLEITYTADTGYDIDSVAVTVGGTPVAGAYNSGTGKVTINDVGGDVVIIVADVSEGA